MLPSLKLYDKVFTLHVNYKSELILSVSLLLRNKLAVVTDLYSIMKIAAGQVDKSKGNIL